jgi:GH18 family chitinase
MGGNCTTTRVVSGDSCGSLAARCGISAANFTQYNPQANLCSTLAVGQYVCCSPGTLPNLAPQQNANGSCASYLVNPGDTCNQIAVSYPPLTVAEIESYNKATWGWLGCSNLQASQNICLSTGTPPFPAPVSGTVCGPQVPNTKPPTDGTAWASLNPCPLNACCDIWGQCGTYPEFCTATNSTTGAPGTAAPGSNGCISNCGVNVVYGSAPAEFASIGYFEAFNGERPCLNMAASQIDQSRYTHVHYAFGNINSDFSVDDGGFTDQFNEFLNLTSVKRIVTFGGWSFSTDPSTYMIFREGVTAANRATLAQNVVNFLTANSLNGVDFDWEYPGEPGDIPGIPAGSPSDGVNYLAFLSELRSIMPAGMTISIAAPASYWYLKQFPIKAIATVVDYIVFMTYDLEGSWGTSNSNAQDGCPSGNCLRSDINITETTYSLSMLTKAGVASNKIMIGVTSYGRSYTMSHAGCTGPMCTYSGPGIAGECTQTAGYMTDAEINKIFATNPTAQRLRDDASNTDILVYNQTQWVGYLNASSRTDRTALYKFLDFGGTAEWAIDLEAFLPAP